MVGSLGDLKSSSFQSDLCLQFVLLQEAHLWGQVYFCQYHNLFPLSLSSPEKAYDKVRKWAKVDIFRKKYLAVPINEDYHWYLAIIYEPEAVIKGLDSEQQDGMMIADDVPK